MKKKFQINWDFWGPFIVGFIITYTIIFVLNNLNNIKL